jgi:HEPN domain-containing protein
LNRSADWLKQAEQDLAAARDSAVAGHHEWAAFQAQQSAEKAVKAWSQAVHGSMRGHSITDILKQLAVSAPVPGAVLDAARELDKVYVTARYPNGFASGSPSDYFTAASSQSLVQHAQDILNFCRSQIP